MSYCVCSQQQSLFLYVSSSPASIFVSSLTLLQFFVFYVQPVIFFWSCLCLKFLGFSSFPTHLLPSTSIVHSVAGPGVDQGDRLYQLEAVAISSN